MGFFERLFGRKTAESPLAPQTEPVLALPAQASQAPEEVLAPPPPPPPPLPPPPLPAAPKAQTAKAPAQKTKANAKNAAAKDGVQKREAGTGDLVDDLIAAVNTTFIEDKAAAKQGAPVQAGKLEVPTGDVEELFKEIVAQYARPLKELVIELRRGTATREWLDICRPALNSIAKATRSMNLPQALERMEQFDKVLASMATSREKNMSAQEQAKVLDGYDRLIEVMPKAFAINEELKQRDTIIIMALLKQIPDVGRVTLDKLYAAGLTSIDVLMLAKRDELAVATGIPGRIAEQICGKLAKYREDSSGTKRVDLKGYRQRLYEQVINLKKAQEAYVKAAAAESSSEKRKQRNARQNIVFQISILLAELGEAELVKDHEQMTFERRIQALDEYLARMAQRK